MLPECSLSVCTSVTLMHSAKIIKQNEYLLNMVSSNIKMSVASHRNGISARRRWSKFALQATVNHHWIWSTFAECRLSLIVVFRFGV